MMRELTVQALPFLHRRSCPQRTTRQFLSDMILRFPETLALLAALVNTVAPPLGLINYYRLHFTIDVATAQSRLTSAFQVHLHLFLVEVAPSPDSVSILARYAGQVMILRDILDQVFPACFLHQ